MMHKAHLYVLIGVMILLSVAVSILTTADLTTADFNSGRSCGQDADCAVLAEDPAQNYYCHSVQKTCYRREAPASKAPPTPEVKTTSPTPEAKTAPPPEKKIEEILAKVQNDVSTLRQSIDKANLASGNIQARLTSIEQGLNSFRDSSGVLSQQQATQGQAVETSLTGLEREVQETKTEVNQLEESSRLIKYIFLVLLIAAIALGLIYYLNRRVPATLQPQVVAYITKHIREGKKFSFIKESLRRAGWSDEEINRAYTETVRQNYQNYVQQRTIIGKAAGGAGVPGKAPKLGRPAPAAARQLTTKHQDKNKVIGIMIVTILLLMGIFFLLSGTVGKAISVTRFINESSGEVRDVVTCTPPQIRAPDGDRCCDDLDNTKVCDSLEQRQAQLQPSAVAGQCTDNLQCETNEHCIDGQCRSLLGIYQGSPVCGKICNYYTVVVSTSDGETYTLKPLRGSYSCVGALEWKIMENADHCQGEKAVVPIAIIMKQPGEIISEQVITLQRRESQEVVHPTLPRCRLNLTIEEIYELCT